MVKKRERDWKYWTEIITICVLGICSGGLAVLYATSKQHLYNVSNYALAISLGFSSLCFSWSRAEDDAKTRVSILQAGRYFIIATICLMSAAIFDYGSINLSQETSYFLRWIGEESRRGYVFYFAFGAFIFVLGIRQIFESLRKDSEHNSKGSR